MRIVIAGVFLAAVACGGSGSSADGSIDEPCGQYALARAKEYEPGDELIPGVISVGMAKGTTSQEAAAFLRTLGTAYTMPGGYREYAIVCVQEGHEDRWVDDLRTHPEIEWAHREGVRPLDAAAE